MRRVKCIHCGDMTPEDLDFCERCGHEPTTPIYYCRCDKCTSTAGGSFDGDDWIDADD